MPDTFSKSKRSEIMAAVKSRGNASTEEKLRLLLRRHGITGWRRHARLPGNPDFVFRSLRVAVFVDGCFWHGCPQHLRVPKSNREYWQRKIERNMTRDRATTRTLRQRGWKVIRIWEHELKDESKTARRLKRALRTAAAAR